SASPGGGAAQALPVSTRGGCGRRMSATRQLEFGIFGPASASLASAGSASHTAQAGCSAMMRFNSAGSTSLSCVKAGTAQAQASAMPSAMAVLFFIIAPIVGPQTSAKGKAASVDGELFQPRQQTDVLPQFDIVMFALAVGLLQG